MVILYLMSDSEIRYHILEPARGIVASLLDGRHTVGELARAIQHVFDLPSLDESRSLLEDTVRVLKEKDEKVAVLQKPSSWFIDYNPLDFIIPQDTFSPERRLSRPLSLMIYYSGRCQTDCLYCYADLANLRRVRHLRLAQWLPILDEARDLDIRIVHLTGGDPMSRKDSVEFLCQLVSRGFLFMVSTKCRVSQDDARQLADAGFNQPVSSVHRYVQVSVDSSDPVTATRLVGRSGYIDRAKSAVRNLLAANIQTHVKSVVTPLNYQHVTGVVEMFAGMGVRHFNFSVYSRTHFRHNDSMFLSDDMKDETANLLASVKERFPDMELTGDAVQYQPAPPADARPSQESWEARAGCSAGRTNLGIGPDGSAVLCEQMPMERPYLVGDLTKQSIMEVWNSPELLAFVYPQRDRFAGSACHDCSDFEHCTQHMGYCFRDALFAYGKIHHPPPNCPSVPPVDYRQS